MTSIFSSIKSLFGDGRNIDIEFKRDSTSHHNKKKYTFICGCGNHQVVGECPDEFKREESVQKFGEVMEQLRETSRSSQLQKLKIVKHSVSPPKSFEFSVPG